MSEWNCDLIKVGKTSYSEIELNAELKAQQRSVDVGLLVFCSPLWVALCLSIAFRAGLFDALIAISFCIEFLFTLTVNYISIKIDYYSALKSLSQSLIQTLTATHTRASTKTTFMTINYIKVTIFIPLLTII